MQREHTCHHLDFELDFELLAKIWENEFLLFKSAVCSVSYSSHRKLIRGQQTHKLLFHEISMWVRPLFALVVALESLPLDSPKLRNILRFEPCPKVTPVEQLGEGLRKQQR